MEPAPRLPGCREAPAKGATAASRIVTAACGALLGLACSQSALLGASARQVAVAAASGGTIEATGDDAPALVGFKLVLHPGDLPADTQLTLQLGPASDDLNAAGPSVLLGPAGLQLVHPAELTLPYSLGPGQLDSELSVELEDGSGQSLRIDRTLLTVDANAHLLRCPLPGLGEVHALAPRHCQQDSECGSGGYCHEMEICRPWYLPDGGIDPEADGGPHHP